MLRRRPAHLALIALAVLSVACGRSGRTPPDGAPAPRREGPAPSTANARVSGQVLTFDASPLYRQMGLLARGLPFPIIGRAGFVASAAPDTTHVVVAVTFANASLTFAREADNRFRAQYSISAVLSRDAAVVASAQASSEVLVGAFRETTRTDESLIHQEILDAAPGRYTLTVTLRDEGSGRSAQESMAVTVPRFGRGTLSTPLPIAEATPRAQLGTVPNLLMNPEGAAVAGRDSLLPLYLEAYGDTSRPVRMLVRSERGTVLWNDTVAVVPRGELRAGIIEVPVARVGIGVAQLAFLFDGGVDTVATYIFVGFGDDVPVATYEEMVNYLRWFARNDRLQRLREAAETERPAAWAAFLRETDDQPQTPVHELLREYFVKVVRANARFREEATPGWLSDRGRVFIALGEPDQIIEPQPADFSRNRQQVWDYRAYNLQLVFFDQTGNGRWRLTQASEVRFESESRRRLR